ncbi:hypothetical protein L1887_59561 [Cichorium endivia]|nr:hypothetical protein L1887_59561 [Cichorium endivia]
MLRLEARVGTSVCLKAGRRLASDKLQARPPMLASSSRCVPTLMVGRSPAEGRHRARAQAYQPQGRGVDTLPLTLAFRTQAAVLCHCTARRLRSDARLTR